MQIVLSLYSLYDWLFTNMLDVSMVLASWMISFYCLALLVVDSKSLGDFIFNQPSWRESNQCQIIGNSHYASA